ncbi:MAG: hypothetical protein HQ578_02485 [Chloroflexi bacterium]|nr:hypothetical protein [Chloroflexota bacterium]
MDFEAASRELKILAGREKLSSLELDRARNLMVELKQAGMSNPEIVEMTEGRWSESTIKGYTRGVQSTDSEPWRSATALFGEMLARNLTLAHVSKTMAITAELEAVDSSLSEIASFVVELKQESIDLRSFVSIFHDWSKAGVTSVDAQSALKYKEQLKGVGFDIETLSDIAEAAGEFDSPTEVLKAVVKYGALVRLDEELKTKREELETLSAEMLNSSQELATTRLKLDEVRNEITTMGKPLATYGRLEAGGFDEKALEELAKLAKKYGTPRKVLTALNRFATVADIKAAVEDTQGKLQEKKAMLKSLEGKYSHLEAAIEMCQELLRQHKFGLDAISTIRATAKKYGEPSEVMKAIEAYGNLGEIQGRISQANIKLAEVEGKVTVVREAYAEHNARNMEMLDQIEALNAKAIEVGRTVGTVQEQVKKDTMARDLLNLLQNPAAASYERYLPLVLVLVKSIGVWTNMNKDKFRYASLIDKNFEELVSHLGGS